MINLFLQNLNTLTIFSVMFLIFFAIFLLSLVIIKKNRQNDVFTKLDELYSKIHNDINFSVTPNLISLSPSTNDLIQLAIEIWRVEKKITKLETFLPENQRKGIKNSIQKFKSYFEKYDIEVIDYTGQKFNEGLNLDILAFEKDSKIKESIIKETMEPTIMCKGQVVKKAKIIVVTK